VNPALIASLAAGGLLAGWPQRALISRLDISPLPHALAAGAVTAVLLGLLAARVHPALVLAAACWLALCAVPLAATDIAAYRLPDPLTAAAYAGTAALLLAAAADVKLAASLGTLLAWFGWRLLIAGGFAGFLLGGMFAAALLVYRRAGRKQSIPFGPFMIAGAVLALVAWPG
jgi:leader peptidase (prepilin peptidase) / N-methyltransferase